MCLEYKKFYEKYLDRTYNTVYFYKIDHLIDKINNQLDSIVKRGLKKLTLNIHPFIAAFLTKGFLSIRMKWFLKYKIWIKIMPRDAYTYLEYRFKNDEGKSIKF